VNKLVISFFLTLMPNICLAATDKVTCTFVAFHSQDEVTMQQVEDFVLTFQWDTATQDAFVEGNNGLSPVVRINGQGGQTFLEILGTGAVQSTTISEYGTAVHSRNSIILGDVFASQYYGKCE
jgi:hypothetical protein